MRVVSALLVCGLLGAGAAASERPKVRRGHPRIYVTASALPALRRKCSGPMKDVYQQMRRADWIMRARPRAGWSDVTNATYPAFHYLVTGERRYLLKTKEYLDAVAARPPRNQYLTPEWIRAGCMAADWVWNDLSPGERAKYGRAMLDLAEWVLKRVWRHSDFNNHFVNEHLSVLYAAVLLDGENIEPKRTARLLAVGRRYLLEHAVPAANEIAGELNRQQWSATPAYVSYLAQPPDARQRDAFFVGGQAEGFSYNDWGYARPLALTCEMWRVATGSDLFRDSSFFRGQSAWHAYGLRPDTNTFARSEDCPSGLRPGGNLKVLMHLLAARLKDPLAEWLAESIRWRYVQNAWQEILFRDLTVTAKSPKQMSLPLAACFGKLGHVYFRSAWNDPAAAFALFQCGPFYAGHQHLDNNAFVIHRSGSLAIDSGTNDYGPHRGNYYCRTIAHNGVVVFDPGESFGGAAWSARGAGGSNDGGQIRATGVNRAGQFNRGGPSDTGRIVAFANGRYCAGAVGDATRSYSPRKVRRAVRAFFHLRPPAAGGAGGDWFVVFDRVETARPGLRSKWLLHCIDRPTIEGSRFTVDRGGGRLLGQVIFPSRPTIQLVGGPGRQSFVNGRNYPPTQKKRDAEHGGWRIEVPFDSQAFVILRAGEKGAASAPRLKTESIQGTLGVRIPCGGLEYRVLLGKGLRALPWVEVYRDGARLETLLRGGERKVR